MRNGRDALTLLLTHVAIRKFHELRPLVPGVPLSAVLRRESPCPAVLSSYSSSSPPWSPAGRGSSFPPVRRAAAPAPRSGRRARPAPSPTPAEPARCSTAPAA